MIRGYLPVAAVFLFSHLGGNAEPNIAKPSQHPYVDPAGNRAAHEPIASHKVNEARVYDFYQRQADYYLSGAEVPEILPAFPGLDAGQHGHWGKHNQNNHNDGRWNDIDHGPLVTQVFYNKDIRVLKGMSIDLGNDLYTVFDPQALCFRSVWEGDFVKFQPFRWGSSRNAEAAGKAWFTEKAAKGWDSDEEGQYLGHYRRGKRLFLHYKIGDTEIIEAAIGTEKSGGKALYRMIGFPKGTKGVKIRTGKVMDGAHCWHFQFESDKENSGEIAKISAGSDGTYWLESGPMEPNSHLLVEYWRGPVENSEEAQGLLFPGTLSASSSLEDILDGLKQGRPGIFDARVVTSGTIGKGISATSPYVVDTIGVPSENPYKTVMQLTGIAFNPDGTALVTTLSGDVWKVSGLISAFESVPNLDRIIWKRFATGFNQPIGIHIDTDGIFVLDRGQITRLHDYNGDDEADYYENYANDFGGYDRSHTHTYGLHRTADGAFTFVQREDILRTGSDRKTRQLAWGVRNCMGVGGSDKLAFVAPQEGTWTPASMIIEVNQGEFYGLPKKGDKNPNIATPLCYIPRGIDNSTGGIIQVKGDRWGELEDHFIGISYGSGSHYLILRDDSGPRPQGATVPLEGDFLAGTMRGAFNPKDGQLYLVGLDGWGDYSTQDGCFHRVRYNNQPFRHPVGFRVASNGIFVDFANPVDVNDAKIFAHQWNYEYANRYGSPEFSVKHPNSLGHDVVKTRKIISLKEGKTIFIEIPEIEPVMQMHLRMHLKTADGKLFKTDLFPSILHLGERFEWDLFEDENESLAPPVAGKPTSIALRIAGKNKANRKPTESGSKIDGARKITINAIGGLQFEQKRIVAKAGEPLSLVLSNKDVMPHNLVIVKPGTVGEVGAKSFAMLNDPEVGKKHYVPSTESVIAHTHVVPPDGTHTLHFKAPAEPGEYPYICTFPGHWEAMRGILKVE